MNKIKIPFFTKGDVGGLTYILTNNIVNYLIVIATLSGVLAWPDEIVYGRVIPGMSGGRRYFLNGLHDEAGRGYHVSCVYLYGVLCSVCFIHDSKYPEFEFCKTNRRKNGQLHIL